MPDNETPAEVEALHDAILEGDVSLMRQGSPGIALSQRHGTCSMPPVLQALRVGTNRPDIVTALLDAGARADFAARESDTPLLVARGGEISARNPHGRTPLHAAVPERRVEEIAALLAVGADPIAQYTQGSMPCSTRGRTPLMVAGGNPEDRGAVGPRGRSRRSRRRWPDAGCLCRGADGQDSRPKGWGASVLWKIAVLVIGKDLASPFRAGLLDSPALIRARGSS